MAANDEWSRVQPFHGVDIARARYLTPAECRRLLNACEGDFRTLVHAAQRGIALSERAVEAIWAKQSAIFYDEPGADEPVS